MTTEETSNGVTVDQRIRKGHRVKRLYHDACDDGSAHGDGHMVVKPTDGDDYVYECRTCGFTVPYNKYDTSPSVTRAR